MFERAAPLLLRLGRRVIRDGRFVPALLLISVLTVIAPDATVGLESDGKLLCNQGPITETIGGNEWKVYGCVDCCSLIFFAAEGNPAFPYYIILTPQDGDYELFSEGAGDASAVEAAKEEIQSFDTQRLRALIQETKQGM